MHGLNIDYEKAFRDLGSGFVALWDWPNNIKMTLTTFFWILVGVIVLLLLAIRLGIKKELLTHVFWLLIGINFMVLMGILWEAISRPIS